MPIPGRSTSDEWLLQIARRDQLKAIIDGREQDNSCCHSDVE
jgi:hypothetical protein